eukprot:s1154_g11.t1
MKKPAGKEPEMLALPPPDNGSVANAEEEIVAATPSAAGEEAPGADAANDAHAEGEEEEPKEEDAVVENEDHRSYPKARKWARTIRSGQVPEDLQQIYEIGAKNSPTPRLFKSQFIPVISATTRCSNTPSTVSFSLMLAFRMHV